MTDNQIAKLLYGKSLYQTKRENFVSLLDQIDLQLNVLIKTICEFKEISEVNPGGADLFFDQISCALRKALHEEFCIDD